MKDENDVFHVRGNLNAVESECRMTAADIRNAKRDVLPTELARLRFDPHLTVRDCVAACGISSTSVWESYELHGYMPRSSEIRRRIAAFFETTEGRIWPARWTRQEQAA